MAITMSGSEPDDAREATFGPGRGASKPPSIVDTANCLPQCRSKLKKFAKQFFDNNDLFLWKIVVSHIVFTVISHKAYVREEICINALLW